MSFPWSYWAYEHNDQHSRAIADLLSSHRGSRTRGSLDTNQSHSTVDSTGQTANVVLPSSTELFYVYGQTLEGCATLSTGKPLFDLLEVFKKWLRIYAGKHSPQILASFNHPCANRRCAHVTNASVSYQVWRRVGPLVESLLGHSHSPADLQTCDTTSMKSKMPALSSTQQSTVNLQHKRLASSAGNPRSRLTIRSSRRRFANGFTANSRSAFRYRPNAICSLGTRKATRAHPFLPKTDVQCGVGGDCRPSSGVGGCVRTCLVDIDAHDMDQPRACHRTIAIYQ